MKLFAFLVCACPTAELDCPFVAVGVDPPAEAMRDGKETYHNGIA
jgi:hypothetical protein